MGRSSRAARSEPLEEKRRRARERAAARKENGGPLHSPAAIKTAAWLKPHQFKAGNKFGIRGAEAKKAINKPITDRYKQALDVEIPPHVSKQLGMARGVTMADVIAWRMISMAAGDHRKSVLAAKEIRESIEGKASQPVEIGFLDSLPDILKQARERLKASEKSG